MTSRREFITMIGGAAGVAGSWCGRSSECNAGDRDFGALARLKTTANQRRPWRKGLSEQEGTSKIETYLSKIDSRPSLNTSGCLNWRLNWSAFSVGPPHRSWERGYREGAPGGDYNYPHCICEWK